MKKIILIIVLMSSLYGCYGQVSNDNINRLQKAAFKLGAAKALNMLQSGEFRDVPTIGEAAELTWVRYKSKE